MLEQINIEKIQLVKTILLDINLFCLFHFITNPKYYVFLWHVSVSKNAIKSYSKIMNDAIPAHFHDVDRDLSDHNEGKIVVTVIVHRALHVYVFGSVVDFLSISC